MGESEEEAKGPATTTSGRVKVSFNLPRPLLRRIRRAAAINRRTISYEIEVGMEAHVAAIESTLGLSAKSLDDDHWPE